eukprot:GHVU01132004.1.p1 GENE.GHVU01132004.1~~GHVU01132004.1.p1  ORF type:complete len:129 (+),score=12.60 GHVU01132004.1:430-816(+)
MKQMKQMREVYSLEVYGSLHSAAIINYRLSIDHRSRVSSSTHLRACNVAGWVSLNIAQPWLSSQRLVESTAADPSIITRQNDDAHMHATKLWEEDCVQPTTNTQHSQRTNEPTDKRGSYMYGNSRVIP